LWLRNPDEWAANEAAKQLKNQAAPSTSVQTLHPHTPHTLYHISH